MGMNSGAEPVRIAVFQGDGIGPEVMRPTLEALRGVEAEGLSVRFDFDVVPAGAAHYRDHGEALPAGSIAAARESDAILLSAMGLPDIRYPDGTEISPQIDLRIELGLYAGVRPVKVGPGGMSPLSDPRASSLDFVVVRESTEGLFASIGKGVVRDDQEARDTMVITRATSEKLFDFAFRLARRRRAAGRGPGLVHCVDKANVFRSFAFFRGVFDEVAARNDDVAAERAYVDATALWMVQKPWMFDVVVTENMFGDILSDLGAGLMGGLGMAPSADVGDDAAVFQPCHGSAPDIAGRGVANPSAMLLSAAMMLDWLGETRGAPDLIAAGERLTDAVWDVASEGRAVTPDLGGTAHTDEVGRAVLEAYRARMKP